MVGRTGTAKAVVLRCRLAHAVSESECEVLEVAWVGVDSSGKISFVCRSREELDAALARGLPAPDGEYEVLDEPEKVLFPGFVDAHIHAPQYANLGLGLNRPLLQWLETLTFPTELHCADAEWARGVYESCVRHTLRGGTTTACYFATIHTPASVLLAQTCHALGQRAFVGKVSMDQNGVFPQYVEAGGHLQAVKEADEFLGAVERLGSPLVVGAVTPRFVPTCSSELMSGLASVAAQRGCLVQTHVSENREEIQLVADMHPECDSYVGVYSRYGLLTPRSLLAHGIHLTDAELALLKQAGSTIVHCPSSNFSLRSGICDIRRIAAAGVNVALGTDISGGPSTSMLDAMKRAILASQVLGMPEWHCEHQSPSKPAPLQWWEALYLATLAGARAVGLSDRIGNFLPGKDFDAVLLDPSPLDGPFDVLHREGTWNLAERLVVSGDDRNVSLVFVKGRCVFKGSSLLSPRTPSSQ